jgi:hypothetical protein
MWESDASVIVDRFMPLTMAVIRSLLLSFVPRKGRGGMVCLGSPLWVETQLGESGQGASPFSLLSCAFGGSLEHPKRITIIAMNLDNSFVIAHPFFEKAWYPYDTYFLGRDQSTKHIGENAPMFEIEDFGLGVQTAKDF